MADYTRTPNYNLYKPSPDADSDVWGDHWNWNADTIDGVLYGGLKGGPFLPVAGGVVSGALSLFGNATSALHAVPLQQLTAATAGGPFLPLTGGSGAPVTGSLFLNNTIVHTPSLVLSGTNNGYQTPIFSQSTLTGSFTDGRSFNVFNIASDNAAAVAPAVAANGFTFILNYGGNAMKGGRIALDATIHQSSATQNTGAFYQALNLAATATQPELNGNTPSLSGGSAVFSAGAYATLTPTALGYSELAGYEQDICVAAQPYAVKGIDVVRIDGGYGTLYQAVEPSMDVAFRVGSTLNAANSNWFNAYAVGAPSSAWPIDPSRGTLFKAFPGQAYSVNPAKAQAGIDLSYVQFSGAAWHSQGAIIDGVGNAFLKGVGLGNWSAALNPSGLVIDTATRQMLTTAAVAAGGTGYNVNEQFSFAGTGRGIVTAQTGGVVTAITVLEYPTSTSPPTNPVATTSLMFANAGQAHGTGLTLTLTWSASNQLTLNYSGGTTSIGGPSTQLNVYPAGGNLFVQAAGGGLILDGVGQTVIGWSGTTSIALNNATSVTGVLTATNGLSFGGQVGATNADLSKHITLHTAGYGMSVTANRINVVAPNGAAFVYSITGTTDVATITYTGGLKLAQGLGLFNGTPVTTKPTLSGAKGSNAALASVIAALVAYGMATDSTTA